MNFSGVSKGSLAGMKLLGLDHMSFSTNGRFVSTDPDDPTVFESIADFSLEKGAMLPQIFGDAVPSDTDVKGDLSITARMHKVGDVILGEYVSVTDYWYDFLDMETMKLVLVITGQFTLRLIT